MSDASLMCREQNRRGDVRAAALFGFDYVDVSEDQLTLYVFFLGKAPAQMELGNLQLSGGARIRNIKITSLRVIRQNDPTLDDHLEVHVNVPGDFSTYTLSAVQSSEDSAPMKGFDPFYASVDFSFKASCPTGLDCKTPSSCPPATNTLPEINYLAKDYESFRQLILDRLALIMPAWQETHAPDLGIALVELMAYTGDYLSYFQDAVATEAYLGTARKRISVRRHARLVDYAMHEGCNARAWITLKTDTDLQLDPKQIFFITAFPGAPGNPILTPANLVNIQSTDYEVFEVMPAQSGATIFIYASHSTIDFYTWGDCQCCLAKGATSATLIDAWVPAPGESGGTPPAAGAPTQPANPAPSSAAPKSATAPNATAAPGSGASSSDGPAGTVRALHLKVGDVLIFEEVLGPKTGNSADADPTHRQAIRLVKVTPAIDSLYNSEGPGSGQPVLEIEWASEDALTFPLCISSRNPAPDCSCMTNVSVARGNVILVDHGADCSDELGVVPTQSTNPACASCSGPASIEILPGAFNPALTQEPLTASQPLPPACSASGMMTQDPRQALPSTVLASIPAAPAFAAASIEPSFTFDDLANPTSLAKALLDKTNASAQFLLYRLSASTRQLLATWDTGTPLPSALELALIAELTAMLQTWLPVSDLLESGPDDLSFVVEVDDDGFGQLRFGDGVLGYAPDAGTSFKASYRTGNGVSGNVGAETITYIVFRQEKLSGVSLSPRNPMAACGGVDPELIEEVKQFAPFSFGTVLERAITADDYATLAEDNARRLSVRESLMSRDPAICATPFRALQGAKAVLRWTGSWYTAMVALDPEGEEGADQPLAEEVALYLAPYRRMGHDLLVAPAQYVALKVTVVVCVLPNYLRGHVESALLGVLGNGVLPDGTLGFFNPDSLGFGEGIYVSKLVAVVQAVPGVRSVKVTELERLTFTDFFTPSPGSELPPDSVLTLGPLEIARLDNDPNFPENGVLLLDMRGGR